jgi:hypothetical protein
MSNPLKTLLAVSLSLNAILLFGMIGVYFSCKGTSRGTAAGDNMNETPMSVVGTRAAARLPASDDPAALRDALKRLGLPDDVVREMVRGYLFGRVEARRGEILAEAASARPYWQRRPGSWLPYSAEQLRELSELQRNAEEQMGRLFGADSILSGWEKARYDFLPVEKAARLRSLESDYRDMRNLILQEMAGFKTADDTVRLALLEKEKESDLLALLTPEEREAYELRHSSTAAGLKAETTGFAMTEDEYKMLHALHRELDEKYPYPSAEDVVTGGVTPDYAKIFAARREAEKKMEEQLKESLGAERYADYERGTRKDYQSLQAAAERFNLSAETVSRAYDARTAAVDEAVRISDDKSLTAEQKKEKYEAVAGEAIEKIRASLGNEIGDAYINNSLGWLKELPKGGRVSISQNGAVRVSQPRPPAPRK